MGQSLIYITPHLSWGFCLKPRVLISYRVLHLFLHVHRINSGLIYWKLFHPHSVDWSFLMCFSVALITGASGMIHKHWLPFRGAAGGLGSAIPPLKQRAEWRTKNAFPLTPWVQSEEFGTSDFTVVLCSTLGYNNSRGRCPENEDETDSDHLRKYWLNGLFSTSKER